MEESSLDKKILKKFGITMGATFFIITIFILIRHKYTILPTSITSVIFFISAFTMPFILKPIYIFWMKLAFILSWINTGLIQLIIFYLIFTPLGLGMRLFGADLLDNKINPAYVAFMSPAQLHPQKWLYWVKKKEYKEIRKNSIVYSDAYKCFKCGERKTKVTQAQTRSADEPMTTFVTCLVCYNTFKFG
jgi:hypothetical protein